ncbi:MAG: FIST N-terminal domain-containing protein [Opitutales bacterium]
MPVLPNYCATRHFPLPLDEEALQTWASGQLDRLNGPVAFGLVFATENALPTIANVIEIIRIYAHVPVLTGCSSTGLIADQREIENEGGISVILCHLPETNVRAIHLPEDLFHGENRVEAFRKALGPEPDAINAWLLFGAPESIGSESWLPDWDRATGGRPTIGGFAGVNPQEPHTTLFVDGEIHGEGAVALGLEGATTVAPLVAQGCRPVGSPWTVTDAEKNVIKKVGNRPILEVLRDTLEGMTRREQMRARGNIFIGLVSNEYKQNFSAGDFLVRNLAAIDPKSGAVAIATPPRIGQNLQFQIRDAATATEDFRHQLAQLETSLGVQAIYGACLCNCVGRGSSLFGTPDHDVSLIHEYFPDLPVGGIFCNGEFGPLNGQTRLHGYTASLALFVSQAESA